MISDVLYVCETMTHFIRFRTEWPVVMKKFILFRQLNSGHFRLALVEHCSLERCRGPGCALRRRGLARIMYTQKFDAFEFV
jgi:hypothetical protein